MTLRELIDIHGIKHSHIAKQLKVTKGGISIMLNDKLTPAREAQIKEVLKTTAISLLDHL